MYNVYSIGEAPAYLSRSFYPISAAEITSREHLHVSSEASDEATCEEVYIVK